MRFLAVSLALAMMLPVCAAKDEFQTSDFLKQHLNSIGTEQARAAVKNRLAQGPVTYKILTGGPQRWDGTQTFLSEGDKFASLLKFPTTVQRTEWFARDGKRISVAQIKPGLYSSFGRFVLTHSEILTEGLWGGTLSTGWPLSHLDEHLAKLQDRGLKKVDGRELHRVDYIPKKSSDLEIQLYFEPDTFRHVMTIYSLTKPGRTDLVEERFAEFKSVDNLTLPGRWTIRFAMGEFSALAAVERFEVTEEKISHNISLDPKNFEIK